MADYAHFLDLPCAEKQAEILIGLRRMEPPQSGHIFFAAISGGE